MYLVESYRTVADYGEAEIEINRSRFIGYVHRVESEEEAREFIAEIKKKHWNATHNCSAYLIGKHDEVQKADDDGEPSGTAGRPILEVLKNTKVKDTVVVITRYFGGTKLGAGGLIRAYGRSTSEVLKAAKLVRRELHKSFEFDIDYTLLGKVENGLRAQDQYIIENITYLDSVIITVLVPVNQAEKLLLWITDETNGQVKSAETKSKYVEFTDN